MAITEKEFVRAFAQSLRSTALANMVQYIVIKPAAYGRMENYLRNLPPRTVEDEDTGDIFEIPGFTFYVDPAVPQENFKMRGLTIVRGN